MIFDLERAHAVFDSINQLKANAEPGSIDDFDFFVTVGDNLYPVVPKNPQNFELEAMIGMFKNRKAIKDIPIFPVRGNHDCKYSDRNTELDLFKKHPTWQMENFYYNKQF